MRRVIYKVVASGVGFVAALSLSDPAASPTSPRIEVVDRAGVGAVAAAYREGTPSVDIAVVWPRVLGPERRFDEIVSEIFDAECNRGTSARGTSLGDPIHLRVLPDVVVLQGAWRPDAWKAGVKRITQCTSIDGIDHRQVEAARGRALAKLGRDNSDVYTVARREAWTALFGDNPVGLTAAGVESVTRGQVLAHVKRYFDLGAAKITLVSSQPPAIVAQQLAALVPAPGSGAVTVPQKPSAAVNTRAVERFVRWERRTTYVLFAFATSPASESMRSRADALASSLGRHGSELRLAVGRIAAKCSVSVRHVAYRRRGVFEIALDCPGSVVDLAIAVVENTVSDTMGGTSVAPVAPDVSMWSSELAVEWERAGSLSVGEAAVSQGAVLHWDRSVTVSVGNQSVSPDAQRRTKGRTRRRGRRKGPRR